MKHTIHAADLHALMASDGLFAVLDVRERGEFNAGQIAGATSLPRSQIEYGIAQLAPNRVIPITVYDDDDGRANLAALTLADVGYRNVSILDGGLPAWRAQKLPTATGVNVPSKTFGEKVHHQRTIPEISADDLRNLQAQEAELTILDVRTPEEYRRFCIPGANNVPGGDLILWAPAFRQRPDRTVVVNCAGRTRSIIGTAALRRLGVQNVRALKNGTMGWVLAGFDLESQPRRGEPTPPDESREMALNLALELAREEKIPALVARELMDGKTEDGATYVIDVRSEAEYAGNHMPQSINVPGGQAVQRADDLIAVRNGRIVFISDHSARAIMAAYWYREMGFVNSTFLRGGLEAWKESGGALTHGVPASEPLGYIREKNKAHLLAPAEVHSVMQKHRAKILDVGTSLDYEAAHLAGARWISRGWLELKVPAFMPDLHQPIIVSCQNGQQSVLAAATLGKIGYREIFVLDGGVRAWLEAGYPIATGLDATLVEPNDVVLSPSIRGSKEDMRRYLEWELRLRVIKEPSDCERGRSRS